MLLAVAFAHLKFQLEGDCPVLSLYEVQLVEAVRGKGLGKWCVQFFELLALRCQACACHCICTAF